jgi:predicted lipoprotein
MDVKAHRSAISDSRPASARARAFVNVATAAVALLHLSGCEIRPLDPSTGRAIIEEQSEQFDAATYVEENWSGSILPALRNGAVDIGTILENLRGLEEERLAELASAVRIVEGRGRVMSLDDASRARLLRVDAPPYDGNEDYALQIGPVIRGTALRDAVPSISFNQFVNQLEYANVARSLNERLVDSVLNDLDPEALVGSEITFVGVLPLRNPDVLMITPIEIRRTDA